jgi:hypothetical protein
VNYYEQFGSKFHKKNSLTVSSFKRSEVYVIKIPVDDFHFISAKISNDFMICNHANCVSMYMNARRAAS